MAAQCFFLNPANFIMQNYKGTIPNKPKNKRGVRLNIWSKFYTVFKYDFQVYHTFRKDLFDKIPVLDSALFLFRLNKFNNILFIYYAILSALRPIHEPIFRDWFYILNEDGERQPLGDEKHIFRSETLQNIYSLLYGYCDVDVTEQFESKEINGLTVWQEDKQAEIAGTWQLPLGERVIIHLKLLKLLRKGFELEEAIKRIR